MSTVGMPAQLSIIRKELADARAETKVELDHIQTALGDMLRDLDDHTRCLRVILRMVKHLHGRAVKGKRRDAARTNR